MCSSSILWYFSPLSSAIPAWKRRQHAVIYQWEIWFRHGDNLPG
ncbi:MAG: hypothetical protein N6V49_13005 [Serratia symbiotica]|nr:hypothetical protein [Serratia symbiotica]